VRPVRARGGGGAHQPGLAVELFGQGEGFFHAGKK
jgi:hypothetical protein